MNRNLNCYIWEHRNVWEAICVDLDIAVHGHTEAEVEDALQVAVEMYLEAVAEMSFEDRWQLLHRRAPWHVRAGLALLAWLPRNRRGTTRRVGYPVPASLLSHA